MNQYREMILSLKILGAYFDGISPIDAIIGLFRSKFV